MEFKNESMAEAIDAMRSAWARDAQFLEDVFGVDHPAVIVLRRCISEAYALENYAYEFVRKPE